MKFIVLHDADFGHKVFVRPDSITMINTCDDSIGVYRQTLVKCAGDGVFVQETAESVAGLVEEWHEKND